ncbi:GlsB/YeaQ/YmgE family stress response membrane protein [Hoeflea sp.]|uniref:GlsB/YeaQ/YmgE family stress response membrane protein n=1 Tax=Hoeflea sp. TaxID=1940281 RepID=UPI00199A32EB|nr:GlsB/YeaQ/YmgE family stress response membrane protein [Hoeflea sp.]MBC7283416.1 GlsB/YeaQ/YmgE family stress response membrane protein [Hoeflea sp.]
MDLNGVGLLGAIIVGGLAGWLAERFMRSNMGLLMNIILGIIGAAFLNFLLGVLGIYTGTGLLVYLIVGFVGACILIALARAIRR